MEVANSNPSIGSTPGILVIRYSSQLFRLEEKEGQTPTSWKVGDQQAGLLKDEPKHEPQCVLKEVVYFTYARMTESCNRFFSFLSFSF